MRRVIYELKRVAPQPVNIVLSCICILLSAACCVLTGNLGEVPTVSESPPKSEPITVKVIYTFRTS